MPLGADFHSVLAAAKSGAEWAWASLYRDLAAPVTGYLAAHGVSEPEDLASEVFLQIARDLLSFQGDEDQFRSWVFVIAHRRLIDAWRTAGRRPRPDSLVDLMSEPQGGDAEEEAMERLTMDEMISAFQTLSDDHRAVLALRIIGDLSLAETAAVLGRRVGAVKALQRRALHALTDSLGHRE